MFCCVSWCFGGFLNLCLALIRGVVVCVVWCWFVLFVLMVGLDCRFDGSVVDLVLGCWLDSFGQSCLFVGVR